ncbi:putative serine esterase-domain-containing protein [Neohortaea acidophila]|uniref:Putative serine esterase-domain-containing protein n=1 Tax=Neohortaea acidophila TaxID=245834 RepID=A0A6A6Q8U9_9PEZI|nr:putative serine esterase-domain-containing protein [Neohortaea acidophila]KAF2488063.1 putative serine esterase-domain-containing protein [Neohortaea acidophila]
MLLLHQAGSVKVGEVVRYTLTYTPANDRILPTPSHLHVKVKNTSAIPLRAAWVHGPYCIHVSAYPSTFNPHQKTEDPSKEGEPQYEPMLKAGGSWQAKLLVPENIRETGAHLGKRKPSTRETGPAENESQPSVTWIIEVASQILFSNSASVHFEFLASRDERGLDLGFAAVASHGHGGPGQIQQLTTDRERKRARDKGHVQTAGVYTKAVRLVVEDTEILWDKPPLPTADGYDERQKRSTDTWKEDEESERTGRSTSKDEKKQKKKKIHLVVLTHGLHSNTGADLLFLKESIDATVRQARMDAKRRRESYSSKRQRTEEVSKSEDADNNKEVDHTAAGEGTATAPLSGGQEDLNEASYDSDEEEETIVRGFTGNAVRTENGIQYLGKRLAKYILRFTYPDQLYLPVKKSLTTALSDTFRSEDSKAKRDGIPVHSGSSIHEPGSSQEQDGLPYTFTKISFVGHSLGGLIQTYAIAYIHKHNPTFFTQIKPVNFICMASPMLGLSNENPMYVKFALDFGLVGRTGQDLGLTWRPPTIARGGWNAVIGGLGAGNKDQKAEDPSAKPLLRILPTGPAHQVLRMFRNRTVYSNVVNDGIVPLRTSCLLFLDWRGLGKVDKARRENGLIGTVAEWGWAELTGQNSNALAARIAAGSPGSGGGVDDDDDDDNEYVRRGEGEAVPQPDEDEVSMDARRVTTRDSYDESTGRNGSSSTGRNGSSDGPNTAATVPQDQQQSEQQHQGVLDSFFNFFRSGGDQKSAHHPSKKTTKALRRGQVVQQTEEEERTTSNPTMRPHLTHAHTGQVQPEERPLASRGDSLTGETGELQAPPRTSIFESAGDILHPPLPSRAWLIDPSSRTRTIFHDRVYHPEDIPAPPPSRPGSRFTRSLKSELSLRGSKSSQSLESHDSAGTGGMKVEEKIARAYHRDLSWRKVLVRLEPDAHNNMIVRRMFANAYGWPVVKHLCDTHFADTYAANTRDENEPARERAVDMNKPIPETGEEVAEQTARQVPERTASEVREARDELADLETPREGATSSYTLKPSSVHSRSSTGTWDDEWLEGDDDDDSDVDERNLVQRLINPMAVKKQQPSPQPAKQRKANDEPPSTPSQPYTDGHRGLSPTTLRSPRSGAEAVKPTFNSADVERVASGTRGVPEARGSTADVGLGRKVEDQTSPTKSRRKSREP